MKYLMGFNESISNDCFFINEVEYTNLTSGKVVRITKKYIDIFILQVTSILERVDLKFNRMNLLFNGTMVQYYHKDISIGLFETTDGYFISKIKFIKNEIFVKCDQEYGLLLLSKRVGNILNSLKIKQNLSSINSLYNL